MIWKDIEENPNYEINEYGQVRNKRNGRIIHGSINNSGYETVSLGHNMNRFTHRLVASTFIDNPSGYSDVNHKDGNKLNNNLENLEWTNRSENVKHAYRNGLNIPSGGGHNKHSVCCEETGICYRSQEDCVKDIGGSIAALSKYLTKGTKSGLYQKKYHIYTNKEAFE